MTIDFQKMRQHVLSHPFPMLFATVSGAHLYGFPSPDSDFDLRGAHLLPLETVISLDAGQQTVEKECWDDGLEIDLVTHDVTKFFGLMLRRNGYVLEQVFSPLLVHAVPAFEELKAIAADCVTRHHAHHYLGFSATQWKLFCKNEPRRVKPLLYVFRVLLTGIHLMRSGHVEANLVTLNREAGLSYIDDLIARKLAGPEKGTLAESDFAFFESEYQRLTRVLEEASRQSSLPDQPTARPALNDLLVRLRLDHRTER